MAMERGWGNVALAASLTLMALAGCFDSSGPIPACSDDGQEYTFWFFDGMRLAPGGPGAAGSEAGNAFSEAFLTDDMREWRSNPLDDGIRITGNVSLEFWARNVGTPAPVVDGDDPSQGYHFFNQFGSDKTFQPSYAIEYADTVPTPDSIDHYQETFQMPPGGFVVERGDQLRLLLTSLVVDSAEGSGHEILFGASHPSALRFTAECWEDQDWQAVAPPVQEAVELPGNQGLFSGALPEEEGVNTHTVWFELHPETHRLSLYMNQSGPNPAKDDLDLVIVDGAGNEVWQAGSPYSSETARLWRPNLEAVLPPGQYGAKVNSYSGNGATAEVTIVQQAPPDAMQGPGRNPMPI